ncbi:FAD-dependent monooxygenase [Klebsiella pneumoniae]
MVICRRGSAQRAAALSKVLPDPGPRRAEIHQRVYTHNARLAERFRINRVLLAATRHTSWRGRDTTAACAKVFDLAWKLALVVNGKAGEALLDSYQQRDHAKAMFGHRRCWRRRSAGRGRARRSLLAAELPAAGEALLSSKCALSRCRTRGRC